MSERGALRTRLDLLSREVAKFGAVGAIGLLVNIAVFNLLRHTTDLQVVRASVLATFVAILCNYVGFRYWTYRDRDKTGRTRELTLFLLFSAAGAVIENGVLYLATYGFGWNTPVQSNFFKILGIGIATLFRFWSYRTWVFKALPAEEAPASPDRFLEQRRPTETVTTTAGTETVTGTDTVTGTETATGTRTEPETAEPDPVRN